MRLLSFLLAGLLAGVSVTLQAGTDQDRIRAALARLIPDAEPDSIQPAPVDGLYEVTYGPQIYYVSADGRYVIQGQVLDIQKQVNLTAQRRSSLVKEAIGKIGEDNMVIFPARNEKHVITVFTDIDCGYCRKLHGEMAKLNDLGISVHYLFFPRAGRGSDSYYKAVSVWCAKDRRQALTDAKQGRPIERKQCDNPVDEHLNLVEALGLRGTPAIVLEDGRIMPGYVPAERLSAMLDAHARR